jgi:hypothetical protein
MIVVRLMGALLTPKQPRFYTGRHRVRPATPGAGHPIEIRHPAV